MSAELIGEFLQHSRNTLLIKCNFCKFTSYQPVTLLNLRLATNYSGEFFQKVFKCLKCLCQ